MFQVGLNIPCRLFVPSLSRTPEVRRDTAAGAGRKCRNRATEQIIWEGVDHRQRFASDKRRPAPTPYSKEYRTPREKNCDERTMAMPRCVVRSQQVLGQASSDATERKQRGSNRVPRLRIASSSGMPLSLPLAKAPGRPRSRRISANKRQQM